MKTRNEMIEWCRKNFIKFEKHDPTELPYGWKWVMATDNDVYNYIISDSGSHTISHDDVYYPLFEPVPEPCAPVTTVDKGAKYKVIIRDRNTGDTLTVDAYDMLEALGITCPSMAHAFKKIAYSGKRGVKDYDTDCNEAINSIEQSMKLNNWRVNK